LARTGDNPGGGSRCGATGTAGNSAWTGVTSPATATSIGEGALIADGSCLAWSGAVGTDTAQHSGAPGAIVREGGGASFPGQQQDVRTSGPQRINSIACAAPDAISAGASSAAMNLLCKRLRIGAE
jgi:hypothetical protein